MKEGGGECHRQIPWVLSVLDHCLTYTASELKTPQKIIFLLNTGQFTFLGFHLKGGHSGGGGSLFLPLSGELRPSEFKVPGKQITEQMHQGDVGCRSGAQEISVGKTVIRHTDMGEVACSTRRERGAAESHTEVRGSVETYKEDSGRRAAIEFQEIGDGEYFREERGVKCCLNEGNMRTERDVTRIIFFQHETNVSVSRSVNRVPVISSPHRVRGSRCFRRRQWCRPEQGGRCSAWNCTPGLCGPHRDRGLGSQDLLGG